MKHKAGSYNLALLILLSIAKSVSITAPSTITTTINSCQQSIQNTPPGICPTWYWYQMQTANTSKCICGGNKYTNAYISQCSYSSPQLLRNYCVTLNDNMTFLGLCPYNTLFNNDFGPNDFVTNDTLKLNEQMCGPLNRTGILCSECQSGLGPAVFSYYRECKECVPDSFGWILFSLRIVLPLTLLCIIVIIFRINIASPALNGFVLCVQLIVNDFNNYPFVVWGIERSYTIVKFVADVYGIFNLDFFTYALPSICISKGMSMLTVISLKYFEALYPIVLLWFLYICIVLHDNGCRIIVFAWKPFHKCLAQFRKSWQIKGSVMNAFTTVLVLSYCKLCLISLHLMQPVRVWDVCGGEANNIYFEASIAAFSTKHIPYVIVASFFTLFFTLLPAFFILFYQNRFFQKFLTYCRFRSALLHEVANITQGCFKNGTEPGTRDYRWFAGFMLILRIELIFCTNQIYYELHYIIAPTIAALLVFSLRPYRVGWCNIVDGIFWMIFPVATSWNMYWTLYDAAWHEFPYTLKLMPLVYILCFTMYSTYKMCRSQYKLKLNQSHTYVNDNDKEEEELPHRVLFPNEYEPLIETS